jgi:cytoskeletal protein CcmA (bactofilin family)
MSWFRKRAPDPAPPRAALPASTSGSAVPVASRSHPVEHSLEIDVSSVDSPGDSADGLVRTVIAVDTTVTGHLTTASDLYIAGQVDGDIESGASVHISSEGTIAGDITALRVRVDAGAGVEGEIHANDVYIDGRVRGNVAAGVRLELGERAEVIGDVRAKTLFVEEGAMLQGRCTTTH